MPSRSHFCVIWMATRSSDSGSAFENEGAQLRRVFDRSFIADQRRRQGRTSTSHSCGRARVEPRAAIDGGGEKAACPEALERFAPPVGEPDARGRRDRAGETIAARILRRHEDVRIAVGREATVRVLRCARRSPPSLIGVRNRRRRSAAAARGGKIAGVGPPQNDVDRNRSAAQRREQRRQRERIADSIEADDQYRR